MRSRSGCNVRAFELVPMRLKLSVRNELSRTSSKRAVQLIKWFYLASLVLNGSRVQVLMTNARFFQPAVVDQVGCTRQCVIRRAKSRSLMEGDRRYQRSFDGGMVGYIRYKPLTLAVNTTPCCCVTSRNPCTRCA